MLSKQVDLKKIKLVIWDLDDTLWTGTISEEQIHISPRVCGLVKMLVGKGVMNSICSKNDLGVATCALAEAGLWDYFVFPSVSWDPKGGRVKEIIENMQLRASNVLFLDDNTSNLFEAQCCLPELLIATPSIISSLVEQAATLPTEDPLHKRLEQYRLLERKKTEKSASSSNIAFLHASNIKVEIGHGCLEEINRIHELVARSNQLNYTKLRPGVDDLRRFLDDPRLLAGHVSVKDKFGDYGLVGFYAAKDGKLIHFVFSCRILGMGVEQYVYDQIGRPALDVVGEVSTALDNGLNPKWINQQSSESAPESITYNGRGRILFKGPCDLSRALSLIGNSSLVDNELTYVSREKHFAVEQHCHSATLVGANAYSDAIKNEILSTVPFADARMFETQFFQGNHSVIVYSVLSESNLGMYLKYGTKDQIVVWGEYINPLTDPDKWDGYLTGKYYTGGLSLTREELERFSQDYESIGRITEAQFYQNLCYIRTHVPKTTLLIILNGSETPHPSHDNPGYRDRHLVHQRMNRILDRFCSEFENTKILNVNQFIDGPHCFLDSINHYASSVTYRLVKELVAMIPSCDENKLEVKGKGAVLLRQLKDAAPKSLKSIFGALRRGRSGPT